MFVPLWVLLLVVVLALMVVAAVLLAAHLEKNSGGDYNFYAPVVGLFGCGGILALGIIASLAVLLMHAWGWV